MELIDTVGVFICSPHVQLDANHLYSNIIFKIRYFIMSATALPLFSFQFCADYAVRMRAATPQVDPATA